MSRFKSERPKRIPRVPLECTRSIRKGILIALSSSLAGDTGANATRNNGVEAPRYKKRKQREQTVIKAPAREQPNDVATRTSLRWKFAWIMHFFLSFSVAINFAFTDSPSDVSRVVSIFLDILLNTRVIHALFCILLFVKKKAVVNSRGEKHLFQYVIQFMLFVSFVYSKHRQKAVKILKKLSTKLKR